MRRALLACVCLGLLGPNPAALWAADAQDKPSISVLDFRVTGIATAEAELFVDFMSSHIVRTGKYRVIDRMQRQSLLQEIEFSKTECSDEKCQLEIGRLLSASQIIVGSIGKVGDWFLLNMKIIAVETGETLRTASEKYQTLNALIEDTERLAFALVGVGPVQTASSGASAAKAPAAKAAPAAGGARVNDMIRAQAKKDQLEKELSDLQGKVDMTAYRAWLEKKGFAARETEGTIEEKIAFVKEYRSSITTHGWSIELGVVYEGGSGSRLYPDGDRLVWTRNGAGLRLGLMYQFGPVFSFGLSVFGAADSVRSPRVDASTNQQTGVYADLDGSALGSLEFVFGNKVEGLAALLATGSGYSGFSGGLSVPLTLRLGLYYRGLNLSYAVNVSVYDDSWGVRDSPILSHYIIAGYSIFLGNRGE
jgi:hypothetical protein